jgi:Protein of unknown function (DUF3089)
MARKFLYFIAGLIVLVILAAIAFRLWPLQIMRAALVPGSAFVLPAVRTPQDYAAQNLWIARPDIPQNPARWLPDGVTPAKGAAAVFFIHPTSYLSRKSWNAQPDNEEANQRAGVYVGHQTSALSIAGEIWAPHYAQATFGTFLTDKPERKQALEAAYGDVVASFRYYLSQIGPDQPIILAGHSQGALHLLRLLREEVAGKAIAKRIVAAYVIGWPISVEADLPALGLPACAGPDATHCILAWQSFAEPAETELLATSFDANPGLTGLPRRGTHMLCINPLTGAQGASAAAASNLGSLKSGETLGKASLIKGAIPARCNERGVLLIGPPPDMGRIVLPGNNYHVYDYSLFWANIRADAARRLSQFGSKAK